MRLGARLAAAAEVFDEIVSRHRPASAALADWGKAHRFAGSGDRAAIGTLVFDALRRRQSIAARMGADSGRALILGCAGSAFGLTAQQIAEAADGSPHALAPLTAEEQAGLVRDLPPDTPAHILGDFPQWLAPSLLRAFGEQAALEGVALAQRAPVDLRVNVLKATRDKVLKALAGFGAEPTAFAPQGVRIKAPAGAAKSPHVEAEPSHGKGWFEVQDEGSQIAAALSGAGPREQVLDLCAGAGGKTLALAAQMQNTGQIYAYDRDKQQLRPIFERLKRAGARNIQVLAGGDEAALRELGARFDLVLVDAPCTGSGTWRRKPDAKWRLKPTSLVERQDDQRAVLDLAAPLVKPGGRLVYVTCSILPEENVDQVEAFLARHRGFTARGYADVWREHMGGDPPPSADGHTDSLLLTPARHATDGFFIAVMNNAP